MNAQLTSLSKTISYALRHRPENYGLTLDKDGFVEVSDLLAAINARRLEQPATREDLEEIIATSDKKRFEIVGSRVRALYGHSTKQTRIKRTSTTPPAVLYHGTTHQALATILKKGLLPMKRQLVHLSVDIEMAQQVGGRRDRNPVILEVNAAKAHADGIEFFEGNKCVWLVDRVPKKYLSVLRK